MSDIAIRVEGLGKLYEVGVARTRYKTLRDQLSNSFNGMFRRNGHNSSSNAQRKADGNHFWALKDVSFQVNQGEVIGIIGRNGAGKSTLLKILTRITEPTEGYAEIRGRVGSLLEVGTGFHAELSGRENIYLSGAILGMKQKEIARKFDEIVAFAEVDQFIDTPMKHYSSGMYMRLAFAVAAHLEPEVLLVDEVLAVGDAEFQKKCLGKMGNVAHEGRVVVFVSHNMAAVQNLCTKGCLLERGNLILAGEVDKVISVYFKKDHASESFVPLADRLDRSGDGSVRFTRAILLNRDNETVSVARSGEPLVIALEYKRTNTFTEQAVICLSFADLYGHRLFTCLSRVSHNGVLRLPLNGQIRCIIPNLPIGAGRYDVSLWCKIGEQLADNIQDAFRMETVAGDFFRTGKQNPSQSGVLVDHTWEIA